MELTIAQVAARLGKTDRQVRYLIQTEKLAAHMNAGRWWVRAEDLPLSEGQEAAVEREDARLTQEVTETSPEPPRVRGRRYQRGLRRFEQTWAWISTQARCSLPTESEWGLPGPNEVLPGPVPALLF